MRKHPLRRSAALLILGLALACAGCAELSEINTASSTSGQISSGGLTGLPPGGTGGIGR